MCWYMPHLVALRDTDLSLCPPRWMNITLWAKITLQWILRALYKPSQASPMDSREACLWVRDMRLRWWQNRWLPKATRRTYQPANRRQDAYSGCFFFRNEKILFILLGFEKCSYLCSAQQCVGTGPVTVYRQRGIDGCPIFILPLSVCSPLWCRRTYVQNIFFSLPLMHQRTSCLGLGIQR